MPLAPRLFLTTTLVLLTAAGAARAGFTDWSYEWSAAPFAVAATGGTRQGAINLEIPGDSAASPPVAPVAVHAFTALTNGADRYDDAAYTLTFKVSDPDSGQSQILTVHGQFDGTVTSDQVSLTNTFIGGSGSQSFDFLGRDYTVTFGFDGPAGPTRTWAGDLTASVVIGGVEAASEVHALTEGPAKAPEPAALFLAVLGLLAVGLAAWRLRDPRAGQGIAACRGD